jgi:hypothetical protein
VTVNNGLFSIYLGSVNPLTAQPQDFLSQLWLGIQPAGAAAELTPRQQLGTAAYAFNLIPGATLVGYYCRYL